MQIPTHSERFTAPIGVSLVYICHFCYVDNFSIPKLLESRKNAITNLNKRHTYRCGKALAMRWNLLSIRGQK